jgi:hypothetical protein
LTAAWLASRQLHAAAAIGIAVTRPAFATDVLIKLVTSNPIKINPIKSNPIKSNPIKINPIEISPI